MRGGITLDLLTVLMLYLLIVMPIEGAVEMYASDSSCFDKSLSEVRNESLPRSFEFEVGQRFEFVVYMPSSIGIIRYEIKRVLKGRALVSSVFTYYVPTSGEDDTTILWDDLITLEETFWIDDQTYQSQSPIYSSRLWSNNIGDIIPGHSSIIKHGGGDDPQCSIPIARVSLKKFDRNDTNVPTIIRLIGQENVEETKKTSKATKIEEEALIFANKILIDINLPFRLVK